MWQWYQFLIAEIPDRRPIVTINLDETSIRFWYDPRKGLKQRRRYQDKKKQLARYASRGQMRKAVTHVAIICDDETIQRYLPQIVLINKHMVSAKSMQSWKGLNGSQMEIWRNKSAWVNNNVFAAIMDRIGQQVKKHAPLHQVVLLMDAHICHFSKLVLRRAAKYGIWPVIIPASTTSLLQPLDTHVFARFKLFLRQQFHYKMMDSANKDMTAQEVLHSLAITIKMVLQGHKWSEVFTQNGFGRDCRIRPHLLEQMEVEEKFKVENTLPTFRQFQHCFPSGRLVPFDELFRSVTNNSAKKKMAVMTKAKVVNTDAKEPWSKRLRPRLHRFGAVVAATRLKRQSGSSDDAFKLREKRIRRMTTPSGEPLPTLKPFPPRGRRSRFFQDVQ